MASSSDDLPLPMGPTTPTSERWRKSKTVSGPK